MALRSVYRHADSNVQLGFTSPGRVSHQCGRRRRHLVGHDPCDERSGHRDPSAFSATNPLVNMTTQVQTTPAMKAEAKELSFFYGGTGQALKSISMGLADRHATALIGPSGCGKTTFLRCLNRMHDHIAGARITGRVVIDGEDIYGSDVAPVDL